RRRPSRSDQLVHPAVDPRAQTSLSAAGAITQRRAFTRARAEMISLFEPTGVGTEIDFAPGESRLRSDCVAFTPLFQCVPAPFTRVTISACVVANCLAPIHGSNSRRDLRPGSCARPSQALL